MRGYDVVENSRIPERSISGLNSSRNHFLPKRPSYLTRAMFETALPTTMAATPIPTRSGGYPSVAR
jgi:hypothetical protein